MHCSLISFICIRGKRTLVLHQLVIYSNQHSKVNHNTHIRITKHRRVCSLWLVSHILYLQSDRCIHGHSGIRFLSNRAICLSAIFHVVSSILFGSITFMYDFFWYSKKPLVFVFVGSIGTTITGAGIGHIFDSWRKKLLKYTWKHIQSLVASAESCPSGGNMHF